MEVVNSTVSGNSAGFAPGGGILNEGSYNGDATLQLANCTLSSNSAYHSTGGGIFNIGHDNGNATLQLANCTLSSNSADYGGGGGISTYAWNHGTASVQVVNCTLSGNSADLGGGIDNETELYSIATILVLHSTLSGNSADLGGGIRNGADDYSRGSIEIGSTIVNAGDTGENIRNYSGTVTSLGYNLSSDDGSGFLTATGDQINTDPLLGPLQDNGGPTFTHALLCGSPAIDQGTNFTASSTDQRGAGFARIYDNLFAPNVTGGDGTDIGAFEVQGICPCDGIEMLIQAVDAAGIRRQDSQPLIVSLKSACDAFNRGSTGAGLNKLHAFQEKVKELVAPGNPTAAAELIALAQQVIDAIKAQPGS